ncbi:hypothetical protein [Thiothrix lacustris]|uniref:hypothetical protein n=1 Tax=Thiothrix lacustris TaxID=525917 RepID=UPI001B809CDD|nr:hypothetical protein [Thiothrix lacustris]
MPLTTNDKRASMPRACDYTKTFHKDWQRLTRSGRYNMKPLNTHAELFEYPKPANTFCQSSIQKAHYTIY